MFTSTCAIICSNENPRSVEVEVDKLNSAQIKILSFLQEHIQAHGVPPSIREIAAHCGFKSNQSVVRHLNALEEMGFIERSQGARGIRLTNSDINPINPEQIALIPLLGSVAAGLPILAEQNVEEHIPVPAEWLPARNGTFLLKVRGDSMTEGIQPGDLVLVDPNLGYSPSEVVVALIDDEATVKRYFPEKDRVILRADNPAYADIVVTRDLKILGKVTGLMRKY